MIALVLAAACFAWVGIFWAVRNDNAGELYDYPQYEDTTLTERNAA